MSEEEPHSDRCCHNVCEVGRRPLRLAVGRAGVLALGEAAARRALYDPLQAELVAARPQLQECGHVRERSYVRTAIDTLIELGADLPTAALAAHLCAACYAAAYAETQNDPELLPATVARAVDRLSELRSPSTSGSLPEPPQA